jgi:hypothetical protein
MSPVNRVIYKHCFSQKVLVFYCWKLTCNFKICNQKHFVYGAFHLGISNTPKVRVDLARSLQDENYEL